MKKLFGYWAFLLCATTPLIAATPNDVAVKVTPAPSVVCYKGTAKFGTPQETVADCESLARSDASARAVGIYSYGAEQGRTKFEVKVTKPVVVVPPVVVPPVVAPPVTDWNFCSDENKPCTVPAGGRIVRYGFGTGWTQKTFPAGVMQCDNATFGNDPAQGQYKVCQYAGAAVPNPPTSPAIGTASLSWSAPTANTDGTPLTNLAGYRVYHGTSPTALTEVIQRPGLGTTYAFLQLASGTHYFAVAAYTNAGVESAMSVVGSKTIP